MLEMISMVLDVAQIILSATLIVLLCKKKKENDEE